MTGHMLGAAGAAEFIACTLAIRNGIVPPTINQEVPDPECDLNYTPNTAVEKKIDTAMSASMGFGGHNAAVVVKKYLIAEADSEFVNLGIYPTGFVNDLRADPRFKIVFENDGVIIFKVPEPVGPTGYHLHFIMKAF